jgi:hypothetical protein
MNRGKTKIGTGRKRKKESESHKLISLHKRHFIPATPFSPDRSEQYSLEQPFPFPSVPTVTTTSTPYCIPQG